MNCRKTRLTDTLTSCVNKAYKRVSELYVFYVFCTHTVAKSGSRSKHKRVWRVLFMLCTSLCRYVEPSFYSITLLEIETNRELAVNE